MTELLQVQNVWSLELSSTKENLVEDVCDVVLIYTEPIFVRLKIVHANDIN